MIKKRIQLRKWIQKKRLALDGLVGRLISSQSVLGKISQMPHRPVNFDSFHDLRYSRLDHFKQMSILPRHRNQSPATCDLKIYQDNLIYTFIKDCIPEGSRLLEIGGGRSRIIEALKSDYEFWNLDRLEGQGFGPVELWHEEGMRLVKSYIGEHSPELPSNYFDMVFSISTVEHFPHDKETVAAILNDIQRILKPGGVSLHAVDGLLHENAYSIHPLVSEAHKRDLIPFAEVTFAELKQDDDKWMLPLYAFYTRWFPLVKKPLKLFGHPFSINVYWKKARN